MRYIIAVSILVLAAALFSCMAVTAESLAIEDAYLDFLDKPTVSKVMDYRASTFWSRVFGLSVLSFFWAIFGMAIERLASKYHTMSSMGIGK